MSKHNPLIKKVKKQFLSINDLIENYFNKIKYLRSNYKKILLNKDNRVFLGFSIVVILTLTYLLIPTFYNKDLIQSQIKSKILKNYNINIKFNKKINYGLLPRPHYSAKNLSILRGDKEIGITKNLKIFIGMGQFFSVKEINMKNLLFHKTDFNIYLEDISFFQKLLQTAPNENKILFKKSNIFFRDNNDEVLFINKIYNNEFSYDSNNLQNVLIAKNEVFNVPFKLIVKNDKFNKKVLSEFVSKKVRLRIDHEINYDKKIKYGLFDILFVNKGTSISYKLNKESIDFSSKDNKNFYKGSIDFKPFHISANFNYEGLSTKNLFEEESIFIDLINAQIFNNENLSAQLNLNVKNITNINELNDLRLNISIEEGKINFSNSTIMWKNDLKVTFSESYLTVEDGISLLGTVLLEFDNLDNFYSSFQIKKKNRKKIKQIEIDYVYDFSTKNISFDNSRINNSQNIKLDEFLNTFNFKKDRSFNKITFKNFVSNFFEAYSG